MMASGVVLAGVARDARCAESDAAVHSAKVRDAVRVLPIITRSRFGEGAKQRYKKIRR
jgi:hypothetical protein